MPSNDDIAHAHAQLRERALAAGFDAETIMNWPLPDRANELRKKIEDMERRIVDQGGQDTTMPLPMAKGPFPISQGFCLASRPLLDKHTESVTKDYAFNRKSFDGGDPRNPADNNTIQVGADELRVTLEQDFKDEDLQHFFSFAINATRGIDPENPPDPVDWEEMMKGGLQTALKRINIAFAVYGASRTCTHQLVRSTRANFHQQSQRAHYYGDHPEMRFPESVWVNDRVRDAWFKAREAAHEAYRIACDEDISYQDARFILPEGTNNFILCEYSLDEFLAVYAYRACSMFQWEIVAIFREMKRVLCEAHPWLEPYVKIGCEKTGGAKDMRADELEHRANGAYDHTCVYQGWEDVEGQCDFPWARDTNRTFRSERHGIRRRDA